MRVVCDTCKKVLGYKCKVCGAPLSAVAKVGEFCGKPKLEKGFGMLTVIEVWAGYCTQWQRCMNAMDGGDSHGRCSECLQKSKEGAG